ncbi:MAG TPA: hypothetical protein ENJ20_01740 [Bacteroidetes bacterium]|nr:hypothetical protein [Bacteroidota bacterium]
MKFIFIKIYVLLSLATLAQEKKTVVTKNFHFNDGLYYSFENLQKNEPSVKKADLFIRYFTNPQTYITQVDSLFNLKNNEKIEAQNVWAIVLEGVPFIQIPKKEAQKKLPTFAALKLRGKICYFAYPVYRPKKIKMAAYNPVTGRPFLTGIVERDKKIIVEKILHFETGEILDFNVDNLLKWIREDRHLVETIERTPREVVEEKLFQLLLIYVDRHEVFLK